MYKLMLVVIKVLCRWLVNATLQYPAHLSDSLYPHMHVYSFSECSGQNYSKHIYDLMGLFGYKQKQFILFQKCLSTSDKAVEKLSCG